jgi:flagellar hook assembly protein FlgD
MDGVENCDICGMAINMGNVRIVNPMQRREMTFPIVALHYLAHGRFAYQANWISGEVDARQLSSILKNFTRIARQDPVFKDNPFRLINHPNPFNESTQIEFILPDAGHATLRIYNINGQLVRILLAGDLSAGPHLVRWNGFDDKGQRVASGVYFYRLEHGGKSLARKMLLVK